MTAPSLAAHRLRRLFAGGYGKDQQARVLLSQLAAELVEMFDSNGSYDGWDVQQRIQATFGQGTLGALCVRCFRPADHTLLECINASVPEQYRLRPVLDYLDHTQDAHDAGKDRCDRIVNNGMGEPTECGRTLPCEYHNSAVPA